MIDTAETYGLYLALATDANIPVGKSLSCELWLLPWMTLSC